MRKDSLLTAKDTRIVDGVEVVNVAKDGGMPVYVPVTSETEEKPSEEPD